MQKTTAPDTPLLQNLTDTELIVETIRAKVEADAVAEGRLFAVPPLFKDEESRNRAAERSRMLGAELDRLTAVQKFYNLKTTLGAAIRFTLLGVKYLGKDGDGYKTRLDEIESRITFGLGAATSGTDGDLDQLRKINCVLETERDGLLDLAGEIDMAITNGAVDPVMSILEKIDANISIANRERSKTESGLNKKITTLQNENAAMKNLIQGGGK